VIEYEQGKAIPNQQILAKMERALGKFTAQCDATWPSVRTEDQHFLDQNAEFEILFCNLNV
jgi:ribosome-binding protein aMBF1 (putative translation factor)